MSTRLWKHPNGTYYVLYGPEQKRRLSTRTKDRGEAEIVHAQFTAGMSDPAPDDPDIGDILDGYKEARLPKVRGKVTLARNVAALKAKLGTLKPTHISDPVMANYAKSRGLADGTILREVGVLRTALNWAKKKRWIMFVPDFETPVETPEPKDRWITKDEARAVIAGCQEFHVRLFITLAVGTVQRGITLLELKWEQVDLDLRRIFPHRGHGKKKRKPVPLNDDCYQILKIAKSIATTDHVIEYRGSPVQSVKNGFRAACRRAGVEDCSPHVLRHSGATWMAMDGVPMEEIARMLGDSLRTTERVYAKYHPDYLKRASSTLQLGSQNA